MTAELGAQLTLPRGPVWRNRLGLAPLTNMQSHDDGALSDDEFAWLIRRGEGDFGLVMTAAAYIRDDGHTFPGQLGAAGEHHLDGLRRLAEGIAATGAVSSLQLQHGGRRGDGALTPVRVAPWDDPAKNATALSTRDVQEVVEDFAASAVLAEQAGFDGVEIHGAHGYLLAQFLDARQNLRNDRYGGSPENRARIIHETIAAVRAATGADFQVGLRLSPRALRHLVERCSCAGRRRLGRRTDRLPGPVAVGCVQGALRGGVRRTAPARLLHRAPPRAGAAGDGRKDTVGRRCAVDPHAGGRLRDDRHRRDHPPRLCRPRGDRSGLRLRSSARDRRAAAGRVGGPGVHRVLVDQLGRLRRLSARADGGPVPQPIGPGQ
ncbi:putative oxidoreductase [Gordonia hirsuta DSM 44140 = NBRC 16056]|uniref:Putative oxidoreductase n=1 Tax=Gordonia hirsuta DSM 44140 = NBRC 16056 TaxID=1121927 RepID=L7L911_9ACTN|nr:putative oxidoreductase [Gordonia hirsuta DSM 44140 = NBRC 16056]